MKKRLSIPLLLCSGGLVYALLASPPVQIAPEPADTASDEPVPDSYAAEVSTRVYGENGELLDLTNASRLRRFMERGRTEFDTPARFGHAGDEGWRASAENGELIEKTEIMYLSGDVSLSYAAEGVEFLSESMVIHVAENIARSTAPVRLWQGEQETVADRLYVELDREVAVLTGNVRSVYVPSQ
ncbi:MAG: LPS export ABC transporter periplasmic protein LptC [Pseudomonadota bacterium]